LKNCKNRQTLEAMPPRQLALGKPPVAGGETPRPPMASGGCPYKKQKMSSCDVFRSLFKRSGGSSVAQLVDSFRQDSGGWRQNHQTLNGFRRLPVQSTKNEQS